ncbi:MAG: hypothetical protein H7Y28_07355 [Rhodoferax sp.]|nr:hypothetical protein [Rhodoferax sp.]
MDASKVKSQPQVQAVSPAVAARRAEQVRQAAQERAQPKEAPQAEKVQEEKPRPTVNNQGQRIGGRLNVTA